MFLVRNSKNHSHFLGGHVAPTLNSPSTPNVLFITALSGEPNLKAADLMYLIPVMFWWDHSHSGACFPPLPSSVSFGPDDWAPSVSTTLGRSTLALEGFIRAQQLGVTASVHPQSVSQSAQWAAPGCWAHCKQLSFFRLTVAPVELNRLLVAGLRNSLSLLQKKGKKKRERESRVKINSSLN